MQPEIGPINTPVLNSEMKKGRLYVLGNQRCPAPPWWVHKSAVIATLNQSTNPNPNPNPFIITPDRSHLHSRANPTIYSSQFNCHCFSGEETIKLLQLCHLVMFSVCSRSHISAWSLNKRDDWMIFSLYLGKNEKPYHHYYLAGRIFRSPLRPISNHNSRNTDKVQPAVFFLRL